MFANASDGITVEPMGGLGNQLFIYATGLAVSRKLGCPLYLDTSWFRGNSDREFGLNAFRNEAIQIQSIKWLRRGSIKIRKTLFPKSQLLGNTYVETSLDFDPGVLQVSKGTRLRGYFQSWKYFEEVRSILRDQVHELMHHSDWYLATKESFTEEGEWLAIHIRRGDFMTKKNRSVHGILGREYYSSAINQFRKYRPLASVKVFSDDSKVAQEIISGLATDVEYVSVPANSHPLESLLLLSMGSGIITANSSFSWWAAWLGQAHDRPVIVPSMWLKGVGVKLDDIFLPEWTILEASNV